jgi:hypothetical protein
MDGATLLSLVVSAVVGGAVYVLIRLLSKVAAGKRKKVIGEAKVIRLPERRR